MTRIHNWAVALDAEITAARTRTFAYGAHDCIQFAARCVIAMTGTDHRLAFPQYESKAEALRIIAEHGSLEALLISVLGKPVAPNQAGRGDVVLVDTPEGDAAGISWANVVFVAIAPAGLASPPRTAIKTAWRV